MSRSTILSSPGLQDSDDVALRSLDELITAMTADDTAVIEYLVQLATQPPEVLGMILDAVPRLPPHPYLVTLLRMIAQGESHSGRGTAIEQLGRLRMPEALSAVDALALTLLPTFSAVAERSARKLRMSGVRGAEPQPAAEVASWRALISPVDGDGVQVTWFVNTRSDGTAPAYRDHAGPRWHRGVFRVGPIPRNACRLTNHSAAFTPLRKTTLSLPSNCWSPNSTLAAT